MHKEEKRLIRQLRKNNEKEFQDKTDRAEKVVTVAMLIIIFACGFICGGLIC